jgi:hypothetical protein
MARGVTVSGGNWAKLAAEIKSSFQLGLIFRHGAWNKATKGHLACGPGHEDEAGITAPDFALDDAVGLGS